MAEMQDGTGTAVSTETDESRVGPDELQISQDQYDALIWTRNALDPAIPDTDLPPWLTFEMHNWLSQRYNSAPCGTAACIGGTMQMREAGMLDGTEDSADLQKRVLRADPRYDRLHDKYHSIDGDHPLHDLFFEYDSYRSQDRALAVAAIDRVLVGQFSNPWQLPLLG